MKTRYKILIIIGISIFAYMFIHSVLPIRCNYLIEEPSECKIIWDLYMFTSIHLQSSVLGDDGIGSWTGTAEGMVKPDGFAITESYSIKLEDNLNFIFLFIIIPALIITGLIIQNKTKGGMRDMRK